MRPWFRWFATTVVIFAPVVHAQTPTKGPSGQTGLVYDGDASIWIDAPSGWVLDTKTGRDDGPLVLLHRRGETWQNGPAVMYVAVFESDSGKNRTVAEVIRDEITHWRGQDTDMVISGPDSVRTGSGDVAQIRRFQSKGRSSYEVVAYLQGEQRVWSLVLTAQSQKAFDRAYPDFLQLVKSYAPALHVLQPSAH